MKKLILASMLFILIGCASNATRKHLMCDIVAADKAIKLFEAGDEGGFKKLMSSMKKSAIANLKALGGPIPDEYIDEGNVEEKYDESAKEAEEQSANIYHIIGAILTMLGVYKYAPQIVKGLQIGGHFLTHTVGWKTGEEGKYEKVDKS